MEYILTFKNTNFAIKAEHILLKEKLDIGVMPLPTQIKAGCGISLRVKEEELKAALQFLHEQNINEIGVYLRSNGNGRYVYKEMA